MDIAPTFQENKEIIMRHETLDSNLAEVLRIKQENELMLKARKKEFRLYTNVRV